jgi:hypothetical protein
MMLVAISSGSLMLTACGGGGGGDGGGGQSAASTAPQAQGSGPIPQGLVGKWKYAITIPLGAMGVSTCPNGEPIEDKSIRVLTIRADGSADLSVVDFDNGASDGCSQATLGTCNREDEREFHSATVALGGQDGSTLELAPNTGVEIFTSLCNAATNFSRQNTPQPISTPWAFVTSPDTGRTALKVLGNPFGISCPDLQGQDRCHTILLEQVQ